MGIGFSCVERETLASARVLKGLHTAWYANHGSHNKVVSSKHERAPGALQFQAIDESLTHLRQRFVALTRRYSGLGSRLHRRGNRTNC
jgi:hypothetical protein